MNEALWKRIDEQTQTIIDLTEQVRLMRSRVETAKPPFGEGLELRILISAFDLVDARDPYAVIEYVIDKARLDLRRAAEPFRARSALQGETK